MNVNSNGYTYTFATIMVVVVAVILSIAAMSWSGRQKANIRQEKKQNILASVGVDVDRSEAEVAFDQYIVQSLTVQNGQVVNEDPTAAFNIDMAAVVKEGVDERAVPLYVAEKDGETFYILPLRGNGLWGPIWGYVALESDGNTVVGANFDHKGETPGLGAEIIAPFFTEQFAGKKLVDAEGNYKSIAVMKKGTGSGDHVVDGISGGTITSDGVSAMLKNCLEPYANYFKNK